MGSASLGSRISTGGAISSPSGVRMTRVTGRVTGADGARDGVGGLGVVVTGGAGLRAGTGGRGWGGLEEGRLAEVGLGDLHAVHEGGGGGAVHESTGEVVEDAVDVDLDGGAVFRELEFERRADFRLGDEHGPVVVGLGWGGDLAAEAGAAFPVVEVAVVAAEALAAEGGCSALVVGEDVTAGLDHRVYPSPGVRLLTRKVES